METGLRYCQKVVLGLIFFYATLFCSLQSKGQTASEAAPPLKKHKRFSIGPKIEGNQLGLQIDQYIDDKYHIYSSDEQYQGLRLGVFAKRDWPRSYWQAEATYFYNTAFVQFENLKPEEDRQPGVIGVWTHTGPIYTYRRAELAALAGYKLKRWLRLQAGGIISYHFYDNFYRHPESLYQQYPAQQNDRIWQDFAFIYHRWLLSGRAGFGVSLGRFMLDASYERNLTRLSSSIPYKGANYLLRQKSYLLQIGLGYTLFKL